MFRPGRWYLLLTNLGRFLALPMTRYALTWLVAVCAVGCAFTHCWNYFNWSYPDVQGVPRSGNSGQTKIDFGGQWAMGRMIVLGEGRHLYERDHLSAMLREGYPEQDQEPRRPGQASDADNLLGWFMEWNDPEAPKTIASCLSPLAGAGILQTLTLAGAAEQSAWQPSQIDAAAEALARKVGGPLYPPINGFVMYPLALFAPQDAYRIHQIVDIVWALLACWGVALLSRGRLWLPALLALIVYYPGFQGNHLLGQNSVMTLAILVGGWLLITRGREGWAGLVWGLLAFKPVWAISFLLVVLLSRRWRGCAAMAVCGIAQIVLTLPVVGVQTWREWLRVGQAAAELYKVDGNWIGFSRDLLGIPRRWMLDLHLPSDQRDVPEAAVVGWALLLGVFALQVVVCLWKRRQVRAVEGPSAAFLLLGGWLCCYHFMYYDVLLTFLPVMLLFTRTGWRLPPQALARVRLLWQAWLLRPWSVVPGPPGCDRFRVTSAESAMLWLPTRRGYGWILNPVALLILALLIGIEGPFRDIGPAVTNALEGLAVELGAINPLWNTLKFEDRGIPWSTFCLMLLWLWCGWRTIRDPAPELPAPPSSLRDGQSLAGALEQSPINGKVVMPLTVP